MAEIIGLTGYTIPGFDNKRCLPYGMLEIRCDGETVWRRIHELPDGTQYVCVKRKRRVVRNVGSLWHPVFRFSERGDTA